MPRYRIESGITGHGYDLTPDSMADHDAAMLLVEQAGQTRRAGGFNLWILWKDKNRVAQVRVFDDNCLYWYSRGFGFRFEGLTASPRDPLSRPGR